MKQHEPTEEELQKINEEIEREFLEKGEEAFSDEKKRRGCKSPLLLRCDAYYFIRYFITKNRPRCNRIFQFLINAMFHNAPQVQFHVVAHIYDNDSVQQIQNDINARLGYRRFQGDNFF